MRLSVTTPLAIVVEADPVAYLRAEDETGAFGVLPGHADFLTTLTVSVITWRDGAGIDHHVAVRGGLFEVRDGDLIRVATREAVADDDLHRLEAGVLAAFGRRTEEEATARTDAQRLYLAAIRQICGFLKSERTGRAPGVLPPGGIDS